MREDELEEYYDREDRLQMAPRLQALRNREEYIERARAGRWEPRRRRRPCARPT